MTEDDVLREILDSLRRLEREVATAPASASGRVSRPTEQFPKVELQIMRAIEARHKACLVDWKEMVSENILQVSDRVGRSEAKIEEIKREMGGRINGVRDEAAKTATGSVVSLVERIDFLASTLKGAPGEQGLEESVRDLEEWVVREEELRRASRERSRFSVMALLQIIGILVAIGLGVVNILLR